MQMFQYFFIVTILINVATAYDCNNFPDGCPICDPETSVQGIYTCSGVPGTSSPRIENDELVQTTDDYMQYYNVLRQTDFIPCETSNGSLATIDKTGYCQTNIMNDAIHVGNRTGMILNNFSGYENDTFPFVALHKIWGDGGTNEYNHGVNRKNCYISGGQETVRYTLNGTIITTDKKVLVTEAHGNLYTGDVPGIVKGAGKQDNGCPRFEEDINKKQRVGGVVASREQYGPGVYNILSYVPRTEDETSGGRGYVFAIWTYHYEEIYVGSAAEQAQYGGPPNQYRNQTTTPCYNMGDIDPTNPSDTCAVAVTSTPNCPDSAACTASGCGDTHSCTYWDTFSGINHEIDFEFPCNSPQYDWNDNMTWNCMNVNTWLNDIGNYDADTGAYYTQVSVTRPQSFISSEPESATVKDYHWYTIDWHVENDHPENNYVAFYVDDPFDPTGKAKVDGHSLPLQPANAPIHKTHKFVPTRFGRLNIGPWMGWWGSGMGRGGSPDFDTAKVRTAFVSITVENQTAGFDFPQTFDQKDKVCDFKDMTAGAFHLGCDNVPNSGLVNDACGVCNGDGSTCAGCDNVPNSGLVNDACGVCNGDGSTCAGCDNVPNSGLMKDACGICGGDGSSCTGCYNCRTSNESIVWVKIVGFAVFLLFVICAVIIYIMTRHNTTKTSTRGTFALVSQVEKIESRTSLKF